MKKDCPAFDRGRWYSFFIESDGSNTNITLADKDMTSATISGNHIHLPLNFISVDYQMIIDNTPISAAAGVKKELYKYANGTHGVTIPEAANFIDLKVYVFGYFEYN